MRTTIDLDPAVLAELRERGRREGRSMGQVASELLARALAQSAGRTRRGALDWRTGALGLPRVDLDDKEAVRAVLDGPP